MIEDKNQPRTSLSELGEFGLIDHLTSNFKLSQSTTVTSIGDDAAVLQYEDEQLLVTTDLLVEGVHFDLSYMPLKHLGYKAVMVNLSDIYAMNGQARQITVSIAVSNRFPLEALEELYAGIENITNYKQNNPILAWNEPFSPYFDSSLIWGPTVGRRFYFGLRIN